MTVIRVYHVFCFIQKWQYLHLKGRVEKSSAGELEVSYHFCPFHTFPTTYVNCSTHHTHSITNLNSGTKLIPSVKKLLTVVSNTKGSNVTLDIRYWSTKSCQNIRILYSNKLKEIMSHYICNRNGYIESQKMCMICSWKSF